MWRVQTSVNRACVTLWIVFQTITLLQSAMVNTTRLVTITSSTQWKKLSTMIYVDTNHFPTTTALRNGSPVIVTSPSSARVALSEQKSKANYNSSSNSNVFLSKHSDFEKLFRKTLEAQKNSQLSASIPTDGNGAVKIEQISKTTLATSSLSIMSNKMRNMEISGRSLGGGIPTLTFPRSRTDAVKAKSTISIVDSKTQGAMSVYSKSSSIVMKNAKSVKIPSRSFSVLESSKTINSLNRTFGKGESLAENVIYSTVQMTSLPQAYSKISGRSGIAISSFIPEIIVSSQALVATTNASPLIATTPVPQLVAKTDVPLLDTINPFSSLVIATDVPLLSAKTPVSALFTTAPPSLVTLLISAPLLVTMTADNLLVSPMITTPIGVPLVKATPDPISIETSSTPLVAITTYSSSLNAAHTADLGMHSSLKYSGMIHQSISSNHSLSSVTNMTQYIPGIIHSKVTASPLAETMTYASSFSATHSADLGMHSSLKPSAMIKYSIYSDQSLSNVTNMTQDIPGIIHSKITASPLVATTTYASSFNATHTEDLEIYASLKPSGMMKQSISSNHSFSSVSNMTQYSAGIIHSKVTASPLVETMTYASSFNATHSADLEIHTSVKPSGMMKHSISSSHSLSSVTNMTQYIPGIFHRKVISSPMVTTTTYASSFNATHTADLEIYASLKSSGMKKQSISSNHSVSSVSNMTQYISGIIHRKVTASRLVETTIYTSSFDATHSADLEIHASLKPPAMMKHSISSSHSLSSVTNMTQYIPGIFYSKVIASPMVTTTTYASSFNATHTADLEIYASLKSSVMKKKSISSNHSVSSVSNMTQYISGIIHRKVTASRLVETTIYTSSFDATHSADLEIHASLKPPAMMKHSISSSHSLSSVTNMTQYIPGIFHSKVIASPMVTTTTYASSFNATHTADLEIYASLKSSVMKKQSISSNHSASSVSNMTQYIPGIIHSKVTASPLVETTTHASSFNATHTADLEIYASLKPPAMMKHSISSSHSLSNVTNMTQYIPGIIHNKVTASPLVATTTYASSFNATHSADLEMHSSVKPSRMMKYSISSNHSLSSVSNMNQYIPGIINRKVTVSPLVATTTYASSFNATHTPDLKMHSSLKSSRMMKQSISSNHSFSSVSNITQYIPGIIHSKVTVKEPLAKTTSDSSLVLTTGHYLSSNATHTATIMIIPVINPGTSMTSKWKQKGVPVLNKTFGVPSSSTYNYTVSGKSTSIKSGIHKESLSQTISSVSSILPSRTTISFHRSPAKTRNSSIIATTIESKMNISVAAIVSTLIVSSVRKTTEKEVMVLTTVPSESTKPLEQEFHVTFKITSEEFTNALSRENSKEFQEKRREIEKMFDRAFKNFPGYISSNVRRFYKGSIGCVVAVFVESKHSSPISKEEIEGPLLKANKSAVFGKYVIGNIEVDEAKPNQKEEKKSWGRWPVIVISILGGVCIVLMVIVISQCIQKRHYTLSLSDSTGIPEYSPQVQLKRTDERSEDGERIPMTSFYPSNDNP